MLQSNALLDRVDHIPFGSRPRLVFRAAHHARGRQPVCQCRQTSVQGEHSVPDVKSCTLFAASLSVSFLLQQPTLAQPASSSTLRTEPCTVCRQTGQKPVQISMIAPNLVQVTSEDESSSSLFTGFPLQTIPEQPASPVQPSSPVPPSSPVEPSSPIQPSQPQAAVPSPSSPLPEALPQQPGPPTPPAPAAAPEDQQKAEEEQRKTLRKTRRSRIKELEDTRAELAEKQLKLIEREKELLDKDQTVSTLREELDLERKLRALLTKEKDKAEEQAALSMGLCTGAFTLP